MTLETVKDLLHRNVVAVAPTMELEFEPEFNFDFIGKKYQNKIKSLDEEKQKIAIELLEKLENILR